MTEEKKVSEETAEILKNILGIMKTDYPEIAVEIVNVYIYHLLGKLDDLITFDSKVFTNLNIEDDCKENLEKALQIIQAIPADFIENEGNYNWYEDPGEFVKDRFTGNDK